MSLTLWRHPVFDWLMGGRPHVWSVGRQSRVEGDEGLSEKGFLKVKVINRFKAYGFTVYICIVKFTSLQSVHKKQSLLDVLPFEATVRTILCKLVRIQYCTYCTGLSTGVAFTFMVPPCLYMSVKLISAIFRKLNNKKELQKSIIYT